MIVRPAHAAAALLIVLSGSACRRVSSGANTAAATASAQADTLQGTISVTGTGFEQQLVLQSGDRRTRLHATPADSAALTRLGGVEVAVRGTPDNGSFRVTTFTALRVGGEPVVDGIVRRDGNVFSLETATGRMTLGNPPDALRAMVGARVWILGSLATGPNSYGVIVPVR